ncbi:ornithine cyclodeaminase family protein [Viridibacterium curvum]|uniref:Ornithine cyclodeaminase family protein n=2 Tax=Viridibacterium curvum TaxID=1101404 RepID=A0ABP9Q8L4_9RHOO
MTARFLSEADVAPFLDMGRVLPAVEAAHRALTMGEAIDVPRRRVRGGGAMQHLLQAAWPVRGVMGFKTYTSTARGARFWLHLFDADSGAPLAVMEADQIGIMRTGAAAGLAARALSRPDAAVVGLLGAGRQARGQMLGLTAVRTVRLFKVYARRANELAEFCVRMAAELGVPVEPAVSAEAAVRDSDIVVTATTSSKPVLEGGWLADGVHVNAIGSNSLLRRELDEVAVLRAGLVCVDSRDTALLEAGDLTALMEKGRLAPRELVELGDVLTGRHPGRQDVKQITLFESQGLAIQDIAVAAMVLQDAGLSDKLSAAENGSASHCGQQLPY